MNNLIYCPRLPNGKDVALSWPLKICRWTNNIYWPVEDNAPSWFKTFDRFLWILGFAIFCMHNDSEIRYFYVNFPNIDDILTGVPTYLVLVEIHLRGFTLGLHKDKYKKLIQYFFAEVYIDKSIHPAQYQKIQRQMRTVYIASLFYLFTLIVYTILQPIYFLAIGKRELLYKMIPLVEYHDHFYIYFPLLLSNVWVGFIVATLVFGEINILATFIYHLNVRYIFMRQNFHNNVKQLLKSNSQTDVVAHYRRFVIETLKENIKLNKFAKDIQNECSFRIFIIFSFTAITLCALGFKVYTSPVTSIGYIFWTVGKIQEILAWGEIGTAIITTTNDISSMYYDSNWELIIERSSNKEDNVRVMKLIILSMTTNKKPFNLTGLNFFSVSLTAALRMLQCAFSYFTCLIAVR